MLSYIGINCLYAYLPSLLDCKLSEGRDCILVSVFAIVHVLHLLLRRHAINKCFLCLAGGAWLFLKVYFLNEAWFFFLQILFRVFYHSITRIASGSNFCISLSEAKLPLQGFPETFSKLSKFNRCLWCASNRL